MKIAIRKGNSLWDELNNVGAVLARPCNGNGICGGCEVLVEGLGRVKSCQFRQEGTYEVILPEQEAFEVLSSDIGEIKVEKDTLFLDVGTTTVAGILITKDGTEAISFINPQRRYGADVMSRIQAASEGQGRKLQELLLTSVLSKLERNTAVYVSANTTMQHLFEGLDCSGLGKAPYTPVRLDAHSYELTYKGLIHEIHMMEGISAFVGADIVSGIRCLEIDRKEELSLLIDLGTNGEMVLGNKDRLLVTSTAAGPAFENNSLAMEIHASGVIALLSYMKANGIMDEFGTLQDRYFETGYEGMTQDLIREIQLAKGAIRAGIELLMENFGCESKDIGNVYLAGGMGKYISVEDAIQIGLLPDSFRDKTKAVGNTSLKGVIQYGDSKWCPPKQVQELVLAEQKDFQERYLTYMNF